jgi:hypothetical protein
MKLQSVAICAFLGATLVSPIDAFAQQKSIRDQLVGTWQAVSIILTRPDGKAIHPFSEKIQGILIFTSDGHTALINSTPGIPKIAANNRIDATPDEARAAYRGTYSYFGTYTVNEGQKSFTIKVTASSYPNEVGTDTTRVVTSVSADELKFTNAAGAGGGKVEATFRRAK